MCFAKGVAAHQEGDFDMNYPGAIVIAAGLIAGAMIATNHGHSQPIASVGRYALTTTAADPSRVWWLDTATGRFTHCHTEGPAGNSRIFCQAGINPDAPPPPGGAPPPPGGTKIR